MIEQTMTVAALSALVDGVIVGDESLVIRNFAPLESAGPGDITFLVKAKDIGRLNDTGATAAIVPLGVESCDTLTVIRVRDPYLAAALIHKRFLEQPFVAKGIHPRAYVGDNCQLNEQQVTVGPLAVIGDRVKLGTGVVIESGAVIGDDVSIGDDTTINANVTIYNGCEIGRRVTIHSGTVIGSDGYGYATNEQGQHIKRPQVGIVRIDDDVEIGANCCVDRAAYGVTWIRSGAKIDNLVQIGHNVVIGENSLLVAQAGLAGSTTLGRNVVLGGQSAIAGHLSIGDQVMVAARGGVHGNLAKGSVVGGAPAIPIRQWAKCCAVYAKLPELQNKVKQNSKAIADFGVKSEHDDK